MKRNLRAIITILCLAKCYCSDWQLKIVNTSPYHFQISDTFKEDNFDPVPSNIRPLSLQTLGIRFNATNNLKVEYGNRLKLYFTKDIRRVQLVDVKHDTNISYTYDSYDSQIPTLVIRAINAEIDKFSFIISSDPQPYRLNNGGDPNTQRSLWLETTKPVFDRIAKEESDAHLMIVNGDLTEFGRSSQWKTFLGAISNIHILVACGLGNHDYEVNTGDCADMDPKSDSTGKNFTHSVPEDSYPDWFPTSLSQWMKSNLEKLVVKVKSFCCPEYFERLKNLCARRMIQRMQDHQRYLKNFLPNFSWDEKSLAYAWNYGSLLRFVQLHNRPNYSVSLPGFFSDTIAIKSSIIWLIADMNEFKNRSYIVNVHDAMSHADLQELRPHFRRIKAIFAGHTHLAGVKCFKGISIFDSGALFKNEFLRVNFTEGGRCLDVLHFVKDEYVSPLITNYCFQSILDNPC